MAADFAGHSFYYHCICVEGYYGKNCEQSQYLLISHSCYPPSYPPPLTLTLQLLSTLIIEYLHGGDGGVGGVGVGVIAVTSCL